MEIKHLVNFAVGDDRLDKWQLKLLQDNASLVEWSFHIHNYVIPAYRRQRHQPKEGMTVKSIETAAKQLQAIYRSK